MHREELATPALLLDLDAFEANVTKMSRHAKAHNRSLRPHGKTHKCPEVAKALLRAGAVGICAAKISEAEAFVENGVSGVLITTAVVGKNKIERAARLAAGHPETIFCVDNEQNVRDLNDAAGAGRVRMNVAIDLWVGRRTGIQPGDAALRLAQLIDSLPNLKFAGLQAYAGHASHVIGFEERRKVSQAAMAPAVQTRCLLESKGLAVPFLSAGSTGTYNIDSEIEGITELQPGSFIFMDVDYRVIGGQDGAVYSDFRPSLSVLTTVVSKPANDVAVVDVGFKGFSTDKPFTPEPRNFKGLTFSWAGDEHGIIKMSGRSVPLNVGDRLEFTVPHCDPTVNLYDRMYCLRGEKVEAVWQIAARGMSQ